jgi:hypothetical protein
VFVCPRLITAEWRRQLHKAADLVATLSAEVDSNGWPSSMHEPLTLGFVFPHILFPPWPLRGTPKMLHLERSMPGAFEREGLGSKKFPTNNEDFAACRSVWCGACHTWDPTDGLFIQEREQFNSESRKSPRSVGTSQARQYRDRMKSLMIMLERVGLKGPYEMVARFLANNHCGYEVAIQMLLDSQRPGKYLSGHS